MPTFAEWRDALLAEVGNVEHPDNSNCNKYSKALGRPCESWCADGQVWVADKTGLRIPSRSAYTPAMSAAYMSAGQWSTTPVPGAFGFVDYPNEGHHPNHVCGIIDVTATTVVSVDFNTSPSTAGSQNHGGCVAVKTRPRKPSGYRWYGFGINTFGPDQPDYVDEDHDMPRVVQFSPTGKPKDTAVFLASYEMDPAPNAAYGRPVRRTFENPSRLAQIVGGGGVVTDPKGNAFPVTNNQFMEVYEDLGRA